MGFTLSTGKNEYDLPGVYRELDSLSNLVASNEAINVGSFFRNIGDILSSIIMINKTNFLSIGKGLGRSELRQYTDNNVVTLAAVYRADVQVLSKVKVHLPNGMVQKFTPTIAALTDVYSKVKVAEFNKDVKNYTRSVYNTILAYDGEGKLDISAPSAYFKSVYTKCVTVEKEIGKFFVTKEHDDTELNLPFSKGYSSVADVKTSVQNLLDIETQLYDIKECPAVVDKVYRRLGKIQKKLKLMQVSPGKEFMQAIIDMCTAIATQFESISGLLKIHMKLEHNTVLNLVRFEDAI